MDDETHRTLIEDTREPLFDACCELVSMGLKGRLEMWGGESYPRMIVHDVERGARFLVSEGESYAARFVRYQLHPNVLARLRTSAADEL